MAKNPYAAKDGGPKDGQTAAWYDWEVEQEQKRFESLTPDQRKAEDQDRRQIQDRRDSETSVSL